MLGAVREIIPGIEINSAQIVSYFSGVRPLPYSDAAATVQISRDHSCAITEAEAGNGFPVYSMIGGKWTTFRGFSEQVADLLLARLGRERRARSEQLAIGGGKDFPRAEAERARWLTAMETRTRLPRNRLEELLERYGARAEALAVYMADGDDQPLKNHSAFTRREMEFILQHERVERLDDLVARRTAFALLGELCRDLLEELASIMASLHGWTAQETQDEVVRTIALLKTRNGIRL